MILYLLKSTLCLALLLGAYHLFLEKEKMHRFNRFFLLFSLVFSLTIPLLPVGLAESPISGLFSGAAHSAEAPASATGQETVIPAVQGEHAESSLPATSLLQSLLLASGLITVILLLRLIFKIDSVFLRVKRRPCIPWKKSIIVLLKEKTAPFSFMNYIFLNEQNYRQGKVRNEVIKHEYAHVRQRHTLDVLFVEILKAFFWFHPLIYFYKRAIQLNHEFLADDAVVSTTDRVTDYQKLLLQALESRSSVPIGSPFSFPLTRKRLFVMTRKGSRFRNISRQFLLLPFVALLALMLGTASSPADHSQPDNPHTISIEVGSSDLINVEGRMIHYSLLDRRLRGMDNPEERMFTITIEPGAHMHEVLSVMNIIHSYSPNIRFTSAPAGYQPDLDTMEDLSQIVKNFMVSAKEYTTLRGNDRTSAELQTLYHDLMSSYNTILEKKQQLFPHNHAEVLPPPPPPSGV